MIPHPYLLALSEGEVRELIAGCRELRSYLAVNGGLRAVHPLGRRLLNIDDALKELLPKESDD